MKWLVIPIEELKQIDSQWEYRRRLPDGTKAILHEEIYNKLVPSTLPVEDEEETKEYPFPLLEESQILDLFNEE